MHSPGLVPAGYVVLEREQAARRKKLGISIALVALMIYAVSSLISGYLAVSGGSIQDRLLLKLTATSILMAGLLYSLIAPTRGSILEIADMEGKKMIAFDVRGKQKITKGDPGALPLAQSSALEWRSRPHLALTSCGSPQLEFVALWDSTERQMASRILPGVTKFYFAMMKSPELSGEDVHRVLLTHLDELVPQLRARM